MAKDPAFLFYSNDFLSGTFTMSNEQVGKYIRLLCLQHQKTILSEKDMINICKEYDEDIFSKFTKTEEGYYNERLKEESLKRKNYTESRRNNKLKSIQNKDILNISTSYDNHMENEIENENINRNKKVKEIKTINASEEWLVLWNEWMEYKRTEFKDSYKTIKSEQIAFDKFKQLSKDNIETGKKIIEQSIANRWKGLFNFKENQNNGKQTFTDAINNATEWGKEFGDLTVEEVFGRSSS